MAKDDIDSEHEDLFALIANSDSDMDSENEHEVRFYDIKNKLHT